MVNKKNLKDKPSTTTKSKRKNAISSDEEDDVNSDSLTDPGETDSDVEEIDDDGDKAKHTTSIRQGKKQDDSKDMTDKTEYVPTIVQKLFLAHKSIGEIGWSEVETMHLMHPNTKSPALFLLHVNEPKVVAKNDADLPKQNSFFIYEVLTMAKSTRSWFVGDTVVSDGNTYTFTPLDPLFLIISAMSKSSQARPLLDHLDETFPGKVSKILNYRTSLEQLQNISNRKVVADIEAYSFSEEKTISWLSQKVKIVADHLQKKRLTASESSISINFTKATSTDTAASSEYLRYACDIVGEYIDESLKIKLLTKFGLPIIRPKRKTDSEHDGTNKKLKSGESVNPLEDYGSAVKSTPQSSAKTGRSKTKELEFQKAAKGTPLLSSFFKVKPKS